MKPEDHTGAFVRACERSRRAAVKYRRRAHHARMRGLVRSARDLGRVSLSELENARIIMDACRRGKEGS